MGARGAFYILSIEKYTAFVSAPDRAAFLDEFERLNEGETTGLFGEGGVGLMDKAWWAMFCILPPGAIDTDRVPCLGDPTSFGTQRLYTDVGGRSWSLLSPSRVQSAAAAWPAFDEGLLRGRYFALGEPVPRTKGWRGLFATRQHWYAEFVSEDDFVYVMGYLDNAGRLLSQAAARAEAVMFEGGG